MPQTKFLYNLKTLRFERAGFPWRQWMFNALGLCFTGSLFFAGLLYIQNRLVETPLEKQLRAENESLNTHKAIVRDELAQQTVLLASLTSADRALHKRILLTDPVATEKTAPYSKEILAADF